MKKFEHINGLVAAVFTPMTPSGDIDPEKIDPLADALSANGVTGVLLGGTTGECLSLSPEERMEIAERWCAAAGSRLKVLVHVGHNCVRTARALSAHARKIGAYGVATFAPSYFRPKSLEDLIAFCSEIASAAADLPFYYYHIPSMTGVCFAMYEFFQAAAERIPNLVGVKFTHEDLMDFGRCLHLEGGRFDMLFGRDEFLLAGLSLGAKGAVGTTYNFAAPLYVRILSAFAAGDMDTAGRLQSQSAELVSVFRQFGELPAAKAIMGMIGLDCGPVRSPLRNLSERSVSELRKRLEGIGFFEYCLRR